MPEEDQIPVKKRRILTSDYDFIVQHVIQEMKMRADDKGRKNNEKLWKEVDRQVHMEPMVKLDVNERPDPDLSWQSALELGDLSVASEILTADVKRLIFPQDRTWMQPHVNIEIDRLQSRQAASKKNPHDKDFIDKLQKQSDAELRGLMTQQHKDFGLKGRIELSIKEALHHGSFVAEVRWKEMQQYGMGGVFDAQAAPVWEPHSMWDSYPELGVHATDIIYQGSMIISSQQPASWIIRQTNFLANARAKVKKEKPTKQIKLLTYYGDIDILRKGGDHVFLPNMKIVIAEKEKVVLSAKPLDNTVIIYQGYDKVDSRDAYFMSPIVKQSPNHKIQTIIVNKFIDNVELKLDPTIIYDGNDPKLIAQGGPKIGPGRQYSTKGGVQNFQQIDVGDPTWAVEAIRYFDQKSDEGTGVTASRAGATRQADRVTATQIEEESSRSEIRTIDFVGKIENGVLAFLYMQHEMNKAMLVLYSFYNPEPGMPDFGEMKKSELPDEVHFEVVGSKGVLSERRRSQATNEVTAFLLGNELTQDIPDLIENARQMYADAGNKNPERLMNNPDEEGRIQKAVQQATEEMQAQLEQASAQLKEQARTLFENKVAIKNAQDKLEISNQKSELHETGLRDTIRQLKGQIEAQGEFLRNIGKISDAQDKLEKDQQDFDHAKELDKASETVGSDEESEKSESQPTVVLNFEKSGGIAVKRDSQSGDMTGGVFVSDAEDIPGQVN